MSKFLRKKLILFVCFFILLIITYCSYCVFQCYGIAWAKTNEIENVNAENEYIELYSEDGTIQKLSAKETEDTIYAEQNSIKRQNQNVQQSFNEQKILDSGKPDDESIVITIMGDGFTSLQQNDFILAAKEIIDNLLGNPALGIDGFYPYNLFRESFTVYAIEVISNESGVSRDANNNNGHIVDNYCGHCLLP